METKDNGVMSSSLYRRIAQTPVGSRMINDLPYRTSMIAVGSLCVNLIFAAMNGVLGIVHSSLWFITLFVYYGILSAMRFYAVTCGLQAKPKRSARSVMRFCGWRFLLLAVVISGVVCMDYTIDRDAAKPLYGMLAIATYTFCKATIAIVNIVKAQKSRSLLLRTLRNISCADAAFSILSLEHAMISTFGKGPEGTKLMVIMDGAVGAAAFLIVAFLGIQMLRGTRESRHPPE